jgi:hypothetical protein
MNGSRAATWVRAWVEFYTRGLPAELRAARRDEIDDDLWCQLEDAADQGRDAAAELVVRLLLGVPADIGWSLSRRGRTESWTVERRSSMTDRNLGALAMAGGLIYTSLAALFVLHGDALWSRGLGDAVLFATAAAALVLAIAGVGLAWHHQERIGILGALGGGLVTIGAIAIIGGNVILLVIGSAVLAAELGRAGVLSRLDWGVHVATAVVVAIGFGVLRVEAQFTSDVGRLLIAAVIAPYFLSWVEIGFSLVRRHRNEPATAGTA